MAPDAPAYDHLRKRLRRMIGPAVRCLFILLAINYTAVLRLPNSLRSPPPPSLASDFFIALSSLSFFSATFGLFPFAGSSLLPFMTSGIGGAYHPPSTEEEGRRIMAAAAPAIVKICTFLLLSVTSASLALFVAGFVYPWRQVLLCVVRPGVFIAPLCALDIMKFGRTYDDCSYLYHHLRNYISSSKN